MSDFTSIPDSGVPFTTFEEDTGVDFVAIGDQGVIVVTTQTGFGEGGFGEGPFGGGTTTVILSGGTTIWTNINTP